MLHNPWRRSLEGFDGLALDQRGLSPELNALAADKLGRKFSSTFDQGSCALIGQNAVLKLAPFPGHRGRFNHELAVSGLRLPGVASPEILETGVSEDHEWIVQTRLPGRPAFELWPEMTALQKMALMERLAECVTEIQSHRVDPNLLHSRFESWGVHVRTAVDRAIDNAAEAIPTSASDRARERADEWTQPLAESGHVTCHGDLWFGNLLVDDDGKLTGIIDWDRLAVAPAEYEIDMLWRFWRAPWDFPMGELRREFTEPLPVELIGPIVAVSSQGLDSKSLNARLSLLELPFSIRKAVIQGCDEVSMNQLETVLSGRWANQLID